MSEPLDTSTLGPIRFPPPEDRTQSYADAFYEIAAMLNIPAQCMSPREVWETQMKPELKRRLFP